MAHAARASGVPEPTWLAPSKCSKPHPPVAACLALFPSHGFLDRVRAELPPGARRVLSQARGDGELERSRIVDELRRRRDLLVLAVAGGGLAEGVDYAGAGLSAVAWAS